MNCWYSQWQKKFKLVNLTDLEDQESIIFNCSSRNKINVLKEILNNNQDSNFIVVDNKREIINQAVLIQLQY